MTYEEIYEMIPSLRRVEKLDENGHRSIHSYEIRGQKLKEFQINALKNHFQDYVLEYSDNKLFDWETVFGNNNPVVIEIGFGMGDSTFRIAMENPDINYIGIEVFLYGFSKLLSLVAQSKLKNIKLIRFDAVQVISDMVKESSVHGFHIFFPDPWPKKRHHKKRLIQAQFTSLLESRLNKEGYIYCVTDWLDYAEQMLSVLSSTKGLINPYCGFASPIEWRPETSFERKGLLKDYSIHELWFEKV